MDLPAERKYMITITHPDGRSQRLGRYRIRFDGKHARAENRTGIPVAELDVTSTEVAGRNWTLYGADGASWALSGCGCGG